MSTEWDENWDEVPPHRRRRRITAMIVALTLVLVAGAWFALARVRDEGAPATVGTSAPAGSTSLTTPGAGGSSATPTPTALAPYPTATASSAGPSTSADSSTTSVTESSATATSVLADATTVETTTAPSPDVAAAPVTLPDGSPVPVLAVFDVDRITLSGAVPSESARERLKALALANSKTPVPIVDLLVIDRQVPIGVPVRVIEMTSSRFPSGSAEILPDHALELDRVANIMNLLPNITVVVVGHADQRGDEATNFALSEARAQAVTAYLASKGVAPSRLAARAVGESDLLSLQDDATALALNRRTDFVFTGLLVGG